MDFGLKISVITVCFNSGRTIGHTLESFFAQSHRDKELVVVDGGSSDDTLKIVDSFGREGVVVVSEPDEGMYDGLNKGLRLFSGDAVGCLNSDDRYHDEGVLADIAGALKGADVVFGNLDFVRNHQEAKIVRQWRGSPFPRGGFRTGWMPAHPTFYVRREVANAVGTFDLSYPTSADYDWMLRAIELNVFSIAFLDRVMVNMMVGGRSTSSIHSHIDHNLQALRSRRRWLGSGLVDYALIAKPLRKIGQYIMRKSGTLKTADGGLPRRSEPSQADEVLS